MKALDALGHQLAFHLMVVRWTPHAVRAHRREVARHIIGLLLGAPALAVVVTVAAGTALAAGAAAAVPGLLGSGAATGFVAGYAGTREIAPLLAALAVSATAGCRYTAELGAARTGAQADALEAMGLRAAAFLVSTRFVAGLVVLGPLSAVALFAAYAGARVAAAAPAGSHDRYVELFASPQDVCWSVAKAVLLGVIVLLVHCYHGYTAKTVEARSVARAVRSALLAVATVEVLFALAVWGTSPIPRIAG